MSESADEYGDLDVARIFNALDTHDVTYVVVQVVTSYSALEPLPRTTSVAFASISQFVLAILQVRPKPRFSASPSGVITHNTGQPGFNSGVLAYPSVR